MKVIVTGGCGFIGSNFVKSLIEYSDDQLPIILDSLTYAGNKSNLDKLGSDNYYFIEGNICDDSLVSSLFKKYNFEGVFHFAAESHVDRSIDGPKDFIQTNIVGTYAMLEQSRQYWQSLQGEKKDNFRFLHVSTDVVYGYLDGTDDYFSEESSYDQSSPYSASTASSDLLVMA